MKSVSLVTIRSVLAANAYSKTTVTMSYNSNSDIF